MRTPKPRSSDSLWCGFALTGTRERFYFAGDTAYCPIFPKVGERYGPFDLGKYLSIVLSLVVVMMVMVIEYDAT